MISSKDFSHDELKCKHCHKNKIDNKSLEEMQLLRDIIGQPLVLSSAYRCVKHPDEKNKFSIGEHSEGKAFDVKCHGLLAILVVVFGFLIGFNRFGIMQKGSLNKRFVHLGNSKQRGYGIWSY